MKKTRLERSLQYKVMSKLRGQKLACEAILDGELI